jgi:hypothetical protein
MPVTAPVACAAVAALATIAGLAGCSAQPRIDTRYHAGDGRWHPFQPQT